MERMKRRRRKDRTRSLASRKSLLVVARLPRLRHSIDSAPHPPARRPAGPPQRKSSRGVPRGSPLSHHRAYSSYSAVSSSLQRGVMGLETDEPELRKPLQRHGFVGRRTA
jgi:hypothetical protein